MKRIIYVVPLAVLFCLPLACRDRAAVAELKQVMAQAEAERQNEATLRRLIEELDKGNYAVWDEICAPDYQCHFPGNAKPISLEDHRQANKAMFAAFPDLHHRIEDSFAKGDRAIFRATLTGTHKGAFMGIPPTGASIEYSATGIARFKDGKIVETWTNADILGLMQQLGLELKPKETAK